MWVECILLRLLATRRRGRRSGQPLRPIIEDAWCRCARPHAAPQDCLVEEVVVDVDPAEYAATQRPDAVECAAKGHSWRDRGRADGLRGRQHPTDRHDFAELIGTKLWEIALRDF